MAQAKSIGGRDSHIESTDNVRNPALTMPRILGGRARKGATSPEQLFAACFGNAVNLPTLGVALHASLPGVEQAQAEEIVAPAHETCPYSRHARQRRGESDRHH